MADSARGRLTSANTTRHAWSHNTASRQGTSSPPLHPTGQQAPLSPPVPASSAFAPSHPQQPPYRPSLPPPATASPSTSPTTSLLRTMAQSTTTDQHLSPNSCCSAPRFRLSLTRAPMISSALGLRLARPLWAMPKMVSSSATVVYHTRGKAPTERHTQHQRHHINRAASHASCLPACLSVCRLARAHPLVWQQLALLPCTPPAHLGVRGDALDRRQVLVAETRVRVEPHQPQPAQHRHQQHREDRPRLTEAEQDGRRLSRVLSRQRNPAGSKVLRVLGPPDTLLL